MCYKFSILHIILQQIKLKINRSLNELEEERMRKRLSLLLVAVFALMLLVACGGESDDYASNDTTDTPAETADETNDETDEAPTATNAGGAIAVVSREEGSGARGAFEELVDVNTEEGVNDMTANAIIQNGNGVVATFVVDNEAAIGYISFATFIERGATLTGLYIDGVAPTTENMLSGEYTLVRPFNFVYMPENIGIVEEAFIAFAASTEGLEILDGLGAVVDMTGAESFDMGAWDLPAQTVSFGGSTSTEATAMELMEEFMAIFPQIEITYESVGSGAGITGAEEGTFSLGFASREIHDTELENGLNVVTYCVDGIVIVVNPANGLTNLTVEQIREIYLGNTTDWSDVQ